MSLLHLLLAPPTLPVAYSNEFKLSRVDDLDGASTTNKVNPGLENGTSTKLDRWVKLRDSPVV